MRWKLQGENTQTNGAMQHQHSLHGSLFTLFWAYFSHFALVWSGSVESLLLLRFKRETLKSRQANKSLRAWTSMLRWFFFFLLILFAISFVCFLHWLFSILAQVLALFKHVSTVGFCIKSLIILLKMIIRQMRKYPKWKQFCKCIYWMYHGHSDMSYAKIIFFRVLFSSFFSSLFVFALF